MKELQDRLVKYVTACGSLVSLEKLTLAATGVGFSEDEILQALEGIGKKLKSTVRGGTIYYQVPPPVKIKEHFKSTIPYPWPGRDGIPEFVMPFPEIDMSFIFLTPEELDKYKAESRGRTFIPKKKYERKRKQSTERSIELSPTQRNLLLAQQ